MKYNLSQNQKDVLKWLVEQAQANKLDKQFYIAFFGGIARKIEGYTGNEAIPEITESTISALERAGVVAIIETAHATAYSLTGEAEQAVATDFADDVDISAILNILAKNGIHIKPAPESNKWQWHSIITTGDDPLDGQGIAPDLASAIGQAVGFLQEKATSIFSQLQTKNNKEFSQES